MPLLDAADLAVAADVARLLDCNPFLPERIELERRILGDAFLPYGAVWHSVGDAFISNPNTPILHARLEALAATVRDRLAAGTPASTAEVDACRGLGLYLLWLRYEDDLYALVEPEGAVDVSRSPVACWDRFASDVDDLLGRLPGPPPDPAHLFAIAFQARRAFHHIFRRFFGGSTPAAALRATVWNAIFSRDGARYRRSRYRWMQNTPILVTGESGTGKDLVARAVAYSRFLPFNPTTRTFAANPYTAYLPTNITAFNAATVESALFGHRRGAFTGADADHQGWFESCGPHGTIFLDEIGDLDPHIQVKLLRVLQQRELQRMGESAVRRFEGRVVSATHHDLELDVARGRFRADLYYRLRGIHIRTPTLRAQLADRPDDLANLALIAARNVLDPDEAADAAAEAVAWIARHRGPDYPWPNNMRELELVVRDVALIGHHESTSRDTTGDTNSEGRELADRMLRCDIDADELRCAYIEYVFSRTASFRETSRLTGVDRRTVATITRRRDQNGAANGGIDGDEGRAEYHGEGKA